MTLETYNPENQQLGNLNVAPPLSQLSVFTTHTQTIYSLQPLLLLLLSYSYTEMQLLCEQLGRGKSGCLRMEEG